ncbi:hypothetical protein H8959_002294 [Pygathrix nigripes]
MDGASRAPGSVTGCLTASTRVMRRSAPKLSRNAARPSSPAPAASTASLVASGAMGLRTVPMAAMKRTAQQTLCFAPPARYHCKNGLCIDKSFICDGQNNCQDNSDEESCESSQEPGSGQVFVTSENQLVYYPSITYAIIGSSVIFVLVVALLALVLHHQRKRNNLMTLPVHRLQHPVLLSRLVVLDHPHHCNVTYNVNNGIQYVASQAEQNASEVGSPPSYSEALLDQRPAWYDLPPPPYSSDTESLNQADLPPYRSRSGSANSASSQAASSLLSVEDTGHSPGQPGPREGTAEPRDSEPRQGTEEV